MSAVSSNAVKDDERESRVVAKIEPEAAGGLVWREGSGEPEILLVYRAGLADWSFPKGKREEGESPLDTALREVAEETGVTAVPVSEANVISYPIGDRTKSVAFFHMYATDAEPTALAGDVTHAAWVPLRVARTLLTHREQKALLASAAPPSLRGHGEARSRVDAALDSPERARLAAESELLRSRLPPVAASPRTLVDRAAREARSGDIDTGWKLLHEARRRTFAALGPAEMVLEATALEHEANTKLTGWRKDAIASLVKTVREDPEAETKRTALTIATRIRDEHSDNLYFGNRLLRKQMAPIAVILAASLVGLGVHNRAFIVPMLLGACGACLSALITFARSTTRLKIPDHLANVWVTLMRPLIGAASGLVAFLFLDSGLFHEPVRLSYLAFAFGFSERFVLAAIETAASTVEKKK